AISPQGVTNYGWVNPQLRFLVRLVRFEGEEGHSGSPPKGRSPRPCSKFPPTSVSSTVLNGSGADISCGNVVQEGARVGCALSAECRFELPLRFNPARHSRPETGLAGLGHPQLLASAIAPALFDGDEAVTLQWQDVSAERGSIHHHLRGES